jgi:hypothetical protein
LTLVDVQVPEGDPVLKVLLSDLLSRPPGSTREAALQAMVLQKLDSVAYRERLAYCAQFLVDNQAADGRWDVGTPVEAPELPPPAPDPPALDPRRRDFGPPTPKPQKIQILKRRAGSKEGDFVNARWAAWGLLACRYAGLIPPAELSAKAAESWRKPGGDAADVASALGVHLFLQGKDWKRDPGVLESVGLLADRPRPTDPRELQALKIAMTHVHSEKLGGREWWPEGVEVLLGAQAADGSWGGTEETCAALRFLHVWQVRDPDHRRK